MSEVESSSAARRSPAEILPRHPYREVAELLVTAVLRARKHGPLRIIATVIGQGSEVCLGFSADQSVNANPSYQYGVRQ